MTVIIAEAGVNHNGNEKLAFDLVDAAHGAGVDIVKFQTFKAKNLVTPSARQADYQIENTQKVESQLAMLSRLELSHQCHRELVDYCKTLGIAFLSTAFDNESLDFLVHDLGLQTLKIGSGELTNAPLILRHAQTGADLIVSTGMATLAEVEAALSVIAFGYIADKQTQPSSESFRAAYFSEAGQTFLKNKVTLLHCTTEYPAPMIDINLKAMDTLSHAFKLEVGYSDHSVGIHVPIAAVARGATVIEKHFTLDQNMDGPDHKASLEPTQLGEMVSAIRHIELALGDGVKGPRPSELGNKEIARKSLVAVADIAVGDVFSTDNLGVMRPGNGASPYHYWELLNKSSTTSYRQGEVIRG